MATKPFTPDIPYVRYFDGNNGDFTSTPRSKLLFSLVEWHSPTLSHLFLPPHSLLHGEQHSDWSHHILSASLSVKIETSSPKPLWVPNRLFTGFNTEGLGDLRLNLPKCAYLCKKMTEPFRIARTDQGVLVSVRTSAPSRLLKLFFFQEYPPLKSNPVSLHLCVEKLSIFSLLSSGRYIKT